MRSHRHIWRSLARKFPKQEKKLESLTFLAKAIGTSLPVPEWSTVQHADCLESK
jgi:hypothetical protein